MVSRSPAIHTLEGFIQKILDFLSFIMAKKIVRDSAVGVSGEQDIVINTKICKYICLFPTFAISANFGIQQKYAIAAKDIRPMITYR
jgi:hypothetical protein